MLLIAYDNVSMVAFVAGGCFLFRISLYFAQAILSHPLALVKLGMFLRDVAAHKNRTGRPKPVIVIGPGDGNGNCLIVAVANEPMSEDTQQARDLAANI